MSVTAGADTTGSEARWLCGAPAEDRKSTTAGNCSGWEALSIEGRALVLARELVLELAVLMLLPTPLLLSTPRGGCGGRGGAARDREAMLSERAVTGEDATSVCCPESP